MNSGFNIIIITIIFNHYQPFQVQEEVADQVQIIIDAMNFNENQIVRFAECMEVMEFLQVLIKSIKSFKNIFTLCFSHKISNDWGDQSKWLDQQQWTAKKLPIWLLKGSNSQKIPLDIKVQRKIGKDQTLDIRSSNFLVNWVHTWKLSKILHDHIFVTKILHTKNA